MGIPYAEVIGDPIAHSKSPLIHKFWLERLGLEGDYRSVRVRPGELGEYLAARRSDPDWRGCNVTIPHKEAIIPFLDRSEDGGIGAVNCILPRDGLLLGSNTDVGGAYRALGAAFSAGVDTSRPLCMIGAGGAAKAALRSLDLLAIHQVHLVVRDVGKGRKLLDSSNLGGKVFTFEEAEDAINGCVGLVNASPLGMIGCPPMPDPVLRGINGLAPGGFAFDMVYSPLRTPLLERAEAAGFHIVDGITMLIGQAEQAFFDFFGASAPLDDQFRLRELLTS